MQSRGDPPLERDEVEWFGEAATFGEDVGSRVVEEWIAAVGAGWRDREQCGQPHQEAESDHRGGREGIRGSPCERTVANGDGDRGGDHESECGRRDDGPEKRGEDRTVESDRSSAIEHDAFDVLTRDEIERRVTEKNDTRCDPEQRGET